METLKSRHYRRSRIINSIQAGLKKIFQLGLLVVIGEYMLLNVINTSISNVSNTKPVFSYSDMPNQIVKLAVSEKPIFRVANTYDTIKKNIDFDGITQKQYPIHVRGSRPDFRALDLQDKEGAKVGYVVKF